MPRNPLLSRVAARVLVPVAISLVAWATSPAWSVSLPAAMPVPEESTTNVTGEPCDWWRRVHEQLEGAEYAGAAAVDGWQFANRAQDMRVHFHGSIVEVGPRTEPHDSRRWQWRTAAWGRAASLTNLDAVSPRPRGDRIEFVHAGIVEWYENRPEGLEQGFTIAARPGGDGPLEVHGNVTGSVRPGKDPNAVDFVDDQGSVIVHYSKLEAYDARGKRLPAHLRSSGAMLTIEVDDRSAVYPIVIDPLIASGWSAEGNQADAFFGASVSTAGDVNGDGYSDVIVGAYGYDNGQSDEGRAYVFLGSASGLNSVPSWTTESNQAGAYYGVCVATAGDVNGDGYGDVLVGASLYDNGEADEGRAFLYLGSATGLELSPAWTAEGNQTTALFGFSCATAGDVNGDGYGDVIVGAYRYDGGQTDEGRAYVYLGSVAGLANTPAWTRESDQADAYMGVSVATAGDVNADGYADVVVGASLFDGGQVDEGRATVYLGSATGLGTLPAWTGEGDQGGAQFGVSVSGAGDVNGDGYADIITGAPFYDNQLANEGKVYVYYGSSFGLTLGWSTEGNQASSRFGGSVATAGDVNGDGYADMVVGAYGYDYQHSPSELYVNAGAAWVYYGSSTGPSFALPSFSIPQHEAYMGFSGGTAGDVDGDGYSDVIVGGLGAAFGELSEGYAVVQRGTPFLPSTSSTVTLMGTQSGSKFAQSAASAGDINGDGYSDLVVGAPLFDGILIDGGQVYIYLGSAEGYTNTPSNVLGGFQNGERLGSAVAGAGDVDGDGYDDVIVGAPFFDHGQADEGRVLVYAGSASGLDIARVWVFESDRAGARFGAAVSTAGDVNGDGYSDVIVGAPGFDNGVNKLGLTYVFLGSAAGLSATPVWTSAGGPIGAWGTTVATAGDVNSDGYSDVLIGDPTEGASSGGRVSLYLGSASGPEANWAWNMYGQSGSRLGRIAPAGDINGDGYSDFMVGAPSFVNSFNRGRVYVFHGSFFGITPGWTQDGTSAGTSFGSSLSTVGDLNDDGYSDVLIGSSGGAFAYLGSPAAMANAPAWQQSGPYQAGYAGDANGDGYADLFVVDILADVLNVYPGNGGSRLDRIPRQRRRNDAAPIGQLGVSDVNAFRLRARGRTAAGRGRLRLEWEVKPLGTAFTGVATKAGFFDAGAPVLGQGSSVPLYEFVSVPSLQTAYHWQLRIGSRSPFFPRTPWFSPPFNAGGETDFRTRNRRTVEVEPLRVSNALSIEAVRPNPVRSAATIHYVLPRAGSVVLTILDVQGRRVATLVDAAQQPGIHLVSWNGRDSQGQRVRSGVYCARLQDGAETVTRKFVRE